MRIHSPSNQLIDYIYFARIHLISYEGMKVVPSFVFTFVRSFVPSYLRTKVLIKKQYLRTL